MRTLDALQERFWLSFELDGWQWTEVDKVQYVTAERTSGLHNSLGLAEEPATSYFRGAGVRGVVTCGNSTP